MRFPTTMATLCGSLLVVVGVVQLTDGGTVGDVPTVALATGGPPPVTAPTAPATSPAPAPTPDPAPEAAHGPVAAPVALALPSIGVDAAAVPVGLATDGTMEIPEDVATVGWYDLGVAPGEDGSAVLAGHVDSRTQGRGAFFDLASLQVGDTATVTHEDGSGSRWVVAGRTSYPKDQAPLAELFRRGGDPQLTLITCGGAFDAGARSYAENVVVVLTPA